MRRDRDIFAVNPATIWSFRQNHPELVIGDCRNYGFTESQLNIVRQSMLVRGVNKWLKVRRDIVAYKLRVRQKIKDFNTLVFVLKRETTDLFCARRDVAEGRRSISDLEKYYRKRAEYKIAKEKLKLLMEIRSTLKSLCMTERWQIWEGKKLRDMNTIKSSD